jgi:hypothetical protein
MLRMRMKRVSALLNWHHNPELLPTINTPGLLRYDNAVFLMTVLLELNIHHETNTVTKTIRVFWGGDGAFDGSVPHFPIDSPGN